MDISLETEMEEIREEVLDSIRYRVWSGFYDAEAVFDSIVDDVLFDSDDQENEWVRREIRNEFEKKIEAERSWPTVTSCDRLDRVFQALGDVAVLAQHRCGMTIQDGLVVIEDVYKERGGKQSGIIGYCFYHLQDMEAAMWGDAGMYLGFGAFSMSRSKGVQIGHLIRDVFEQAGFEVVWDGSIHSRLLLKDFRWQRRSPGADAP